MIEDKTRRPEGSFSCGIVKAPLVTSSDQLKSKGQDSNCTGTTRAYWDLLRGNLGILRAGDLAEILDLAKGNLVNPAFLPSYRGGFQRYSWRRLYNLAFLRYSWRWLYNLAFLRYSWCRLCNLAFLTKTTES
ncbi:hypothetical protein VNO77_37928 [Canavalia gladiata]|uniref:Uncharacterized protein n=1 Tax=Canavalia gladiata TaxID=3824 RepID=A0AAN9KCH9_CANGL